MVRHPCRNQALNASKDMDVVKAILLREEYILRAKAKLSNHGAKLGKDPNEFSTFIGLLDLLRSTTVDATEALTQWRTSEGNPGPFVWKGMNYLLKIPTDLNFLDEHEVVAR